MVRVVSGRIQVLVFAHGYRLRVLALADRGRASSLRNLVLIVVLLLRRCVDGLVPPVARIECTVWGLLSDSRRLPAVNGVLGITKGVVGSHVARDGVVKSIMLTLHLLLPNALHQAVHHEVVRLDERGMDNCAELLLLAVWHHLHVARGEAAARVPLVLLAVGLGAGSGSLLLAGDCRVHLVGTPRVLCAPGGVLNCVAGCGNVLNLAGSHALRCRV